MSKADQLTEPLAHHGEGAVWYSGWGGLKWVDMYAGDILSLELETGRVSRLHVGSPIAAVVRPRTAGGFVVATERELSLWDDGVRQWSTPPLWSDPERRFNEGGCDPTGGIICGSMVSNDGPMAAEVFRMDAAGTVERLFGDVRISNGLGFTSDGTRMYYVDTPTRRIDVFDADRGRLFDRRPFVTVEEGRGYPDGLWVDDQDGVWVALYAGSAVHHYNSEGVLEDIVEVGATQVTSCTFGGANLDTLFITTSRENLSEKEQPMAGAVFSAPVGVRGLPVLTYGA
jgi:sugar lactone lactonase YvrE